MLDQLRDDGYEMFVSSGGNSEFAQVRSERAGIDGYFRRILGTDEGVYRMAKGEGHFALIAEALGIEVEALREQAWFTGDGPYDMQIGSAAGIRSIGRLTGDNGAQLRKAGAAVLVRDLRELLTLLEAA